MTVMMVMLLVRRRHQDTLYRWPFMLFAVADARREDHDALLREFYSQPSCCREPGFARELRDLVTYDALAGDLPRWRWVFLMTAFVMNFTIAAVERRHSVHARYANPNKP